MYFPDPVLPCLLSCESEWQFLWQLSGFDEQAQLQKQELEFDSLAEPVFYACVSGESI